MFAVWAMRRLPAFKKGGANGRRGDDLRSMSFAAWPCRLCLARHRYSPRLPLPARDAQIRRGLGSGASNRARTARLVLLVASDCDHALGRFDPTAPRVGDDSGCDSIGSKSGRGDWMIAFVRRATDQETSGEGF